MTGRESIRHQIREICSAIGVADTIDMLESVVNDKLDRITEQMKTAQDERLQECTVLMYHWEKVITYLRNARFTARSTMAIVTDRNKLDKNLGDKSP